ncbi:MAG: efflux transporter outer membrane subunit [Candidatus Accumulibacter sp.]|jgi:NodT family efflux transporter outer membrane factor (OMF) lipoprotein|nr:efflux transporter outer membrane subunit [Accumulibacter sp.]
MLDSTDAEARNFYPETTLWTRPPALRNSLDDGNERSTTVPGFTMKSARIIVSTRFYRMLPLAALVFALGGCAMLAPAPDLSQRQSSVEVPGEWRQTAPPVEARTPEVQDLARWWRRLGDPLLDELIERGLNTAPDLRAAQIRLRQARISRDQTAADWFPSLGFSGGASRSPGSGSATNTSYSARFDASWEPDIFGGVRHAVSGAESDLAAQAARLEDAQVTLTAEIARNYVEYRANQQRLAIARKNALSQEETLQITRWRAAAGLVTELDVEQARTSVEQTRATIPTLENTMTASLHRLDILLGLTPGSLLGLYSRQLATALPLPHAPDEIAVGIPSDALRRRPDVRAVEQTLLAETARVYVRVAARYPSLKLSGQFGWQDTSFAALGGSATIVRSLAASLTATLFDAGRIENQIAIQDAVQEQALVSYEQILLTALEDVENALSTYAAGRRREVNRVQAADAARNAAQMASQMYQAGLVDFQKVLDTQRTLLSAEDGLVVSQSDILTSLIQLYKTLGGGWEPATETASVPAPQNLPLQKLSGESHP